MKSSENTDCLERIRTILSSPFIPGDVCRPRLRASSLDFSSKVLEPQEFFVFIALVILAVVISVVVFGPRTPGLTPNRFLINVGLLC